MMRLRAAMGMGQQVQPDQLLDFGRVEHELFQKRAVRLDRRQQRLESRWAAPQGSHIERLHRSLDLLPRRTILKLIP